MEFVPYRLDDFVINSDIAQGFKKFDCHNIPNILMYGVNNSGKKTLVDALLNHLYNDDINQKKRLCQTEIRIGNNKVEIDYVSTKYHIEINLYEYGLYDKDILTDFVYSLIDNKSLIEYPFKTLIINHTDRISENSQLILTRMLDKCSKTVRVMLICEDLSKIQKSLLSRCYMVRVPLPGTNDLKKYLGNVSKKHSKISAPQQNRIISTCNNDMYLLNQIILATINNPKFNYNKVENINRDILKIFRLIEVPNLASIMEIRSICYNLLLLNYSMKELFNKIVFHFIDRVADNSKAEFSEYVADINFDMGNMEHDIISIEFLILKVKKELLLNK